ncbi:hypothetical protein BLOT_002913 [Blomia tropicalis]|nr:hypothetical protein BLOT_002913 [Blomia tropicalis]
MFAKRYGITKKRKMKNYKIQSVLSNEHVKIKFDIPIITELRLDHNKPDIMVHDKRARKIWLIEVGTTHKNILSTTETTKARKYESLANELKCLNPGDGCGLRAGRVNVGWPGNPPLQALHGLATS